jgi:glycine/D-amino acid oxidase-like deaminating enzyme/nitrite reductase/ring-hydroxylating ferredoxin subunit
MATTHDIKKQFNATSGDTDAVWKHLDPFSERVAFTKLSENQETDVCVVGSGIAGISVAYELVKRGVNVILIEARDALSGETGRTSGHLASALDDEYSEIEKKHGEKGAKLAADSHTWALRRVGEIAKELGIECEYRTLRGYKVSQYERGDSNYAKDVEGLKEEVEAATRAGLRVKYDDGLTIKGWDGKPDQRGGIIYEEQATFHPTKYVNGVLKWLKTQNNFKGFTQTRMMSASETGLLGIGAHKVKVETIDGQTILCNHAVEATNVPLQKLSVIAEMEYIRTYCIAIRVPKGSFEDSLIYDSADPYIYIRFTPCDDSNDYLVIGGCDHKVGQEQTTGRFEELESWVRQRFTKAGSVDYKWSGQVFEPVDYMAFIGKNPMTKHTYIVTGDSGNGLTHGVLAGKLIADEIQAIENPWSELYSPSRKLSILKSAVATISHDLQINAQYKRLLQSDIHDIEELPRGCGGVLNSVASKPVAVYKDEQGNVTKVSAFCPHLKGVVSWNSVEKSWDCPVHGSRFAPDGTCVQGPAKAGLSPIEG